MNTDDIKKLIEAMKEVFPTATQVKAGFDHVDERFSRIETKLENIENILLAKQQEKIEQLEKRVKRLEEMLPA